MVFKNISQLQNTKWLFLQYVPSFSDAPIFLHVTYVNISSSPDSLKILSEMFVILFHRFGTQRGVVHLHWTLSIRNKLKGDSVLVSVVLIITLLRSWVILHSLWLFRRASIVSPFISSKSPLLFFLYCEWLKNSFYLILLNCQWASRTSNIKNVKLMFSLQFNVDRNLYIYFK